MPLPDNKTAVPFKVGFQTLHYAKTENQKLYYNTCMCRILYVQWKENGSINMYVECRLMGGA